MKNKNAKQILKNKLEKVKHKAKLCYFECTSCGSCSDTDFTSYDMDEPCCSEPNWIELDEPIDLDDEVKSDSRGKDEMLEALELALEQFIHIDNDATQDEELKLHTKLNIKRINEVIAKARGES